MRVLFVTRSLNIGGAERQLLANAVGLKNRGHTIEIALFYMEGNFVDEARKAGIDVVWLGKRGRWDNIRMIVNLARRIRRFSPDVVYAFMSTANIAASVAKLLVPGTRLAWGLRTANVRWSDHGRVLDLIDRIEGLLSRTANSIICNSRAALAELGNKGWHSKSAVVVYNIIDVERFRPRAEQRESQRVAWAVSSEEFVVGIAARIDVFKDYDTFIRAAAIASEVNDRLRFVCVGSGPTQLEAEKKQLAASLGLSERMIWLGARSDIENIYCGFDAYCSSSITEGFSNTLAEGMAVDLPPIATDVGDSANIVGDTGWVVPAGNPHALAAAILSCASGAVSRPSARARILERFAPESVLNSLETELRKVAS